MYLKKYNKYKEGNFHEEIFMKKLKKWLGIICAMCLLVNLLMVHASGNLQIEMWTIASTNRVPVLTLSLGNESGQVRYGDMIG